MKYELLLFIISVSLSLVWKDFCGIFVFIVIPVNYICEIVQQLCA